MTREESLEGYKVNNGRIMSPGKFEGEKVYAPYFYDDSLNGLWEKNRDDVLYCVPTFEEHKMFPELKGKRFIHITEDDQGFVRVW